MIPLDRRAVDESTFLLRKNAAFFRVTSEIQKSNFYKDLNEILEWNETFKILGKKREAE
jgi:hypothetical protein